MVHLIEGNFKINCGDTVGSEKFIKKGDELVAHKGFDAVVQELIFN